MSLQIQNTGEEDRLLAASSPVATAIDLHHSRLVDGRLAMIAVPEGIPVPGGEGIVLEPGSSHLMLCGLNAALVQGAAFPLVLRFQRAGEVSVTARVRRKVDAAGTKPFPPVAAGDLRLSLVSAPPAPAANRSPTSSCSRRSGSQPRVG